MVDVALLCRQLVQARRGSRSQRGPSRRLQYTTNVVYLWESGRRWPTASTFFWLAHRTGCDLDEALASFHEPDPTAAPLWKPAGTAAPLWKPAGTAALMRHLQGSLSATRLAHQLGHSRHAVGRWLRGEAEPKLPDFLRFVELTSTRLLDFVARFADPATLSSTAAPWRRVEAARILTREQPWAPAVLLALELEAYRDGPGRGGLIGPSRPRPGALRGRRPA